MTRLRGEGLRLRGEGLRLRGEGLRLRGEGLRLRGGGEGLLLWLLGSLLMVDLFLGEGERLRL